MGFLDDFKLKPIPKYPFGTASREATHEVVLKGGLYSNSCSWLLMELICSKFVESFVIMLGRPLRPHNKRFDSK